MPSSQFLYQFKATELHFHDIATLQNGALPVPNARDVIEPINELLSYPFALKLGTKDWHPKNHVSFASNHAGNPAPFTSSATIVHPDNPEHKYESTLWPVHCVQGTPGSEFVQGFESHRLDSTILKGTDARVEMYSAFCDPFKWTEAGAVSLSGLAPTMKEQGITDVYIVGLAEDYCVKATAEDAVRFSFRSYVIKQATRAVGGDAAARRVEEEMMAKGVRIIGIADESLSWVKTLDS